MELQGISLIVLVVILVIVFRGVDYVYGESREFIISYGGKEHSIVAMNFYSACRNVILKECGAGVKFYICRFYSYKDRDNKRIENYLLPKMILMMI